MDKHGNILVNNAEPDFINLHISAASMPTSGKP
jgi:hypothetical protein